MGRILGVGIEPNHPRSDRIVFLPIGDRHDYFERENADGVIINNDGKAGFSDFCADSWIKKVRQLSRMRRDGAKYRKVAAWKKLL